MAAKSPETRMPASRPLDPFRRAVLRGLAVLLPPLLTIVIFLWVGNTVITYLLEPFERIARGTLMRYATDIQPEGVEATAIYDEDRQGRDGGQPAYYLLADEPGKPYALTADNRYIPLHVHQAVASRLGRSTSKDAEDFYRAYFNQEYLNRGYLIPVFLGVLILVLYLLGKFLAAGMGRFIWAQFERLIKRLPLVSSVYSSVKQVTDFMFTEPQLEATRVVAIEYPRRGIWTLAMVTGESMLDIRAAANEPVLSVLVPTSPMPFTGFTMTVRKSETIDLNITMDQAIQFIVSCGVVVPPHQVAGDIDDRDRILTADSAHSLPTPSRMNADE